MNWIDTLPAIPLARGVAVRSLRGVHVGSFPAGVVLRPRQMLAHRCLRRTDRERVAVAWLAGDSSLQQHETLRVDLADPQGFGYALRYACQHCDPSISYLWPAMASRWVRGETTDSDRIALAYALAELVGGAS